MKGSPFSLTKKTAKNQMPKSDSDRTKSRESAPRESGKGKGEEESAGGGEKFVHCALLGDGMVGKTSLTLRYTQRRFSDHYTATVFDNYPVPVCVGGEDFTISVFDTAGQRDYESLRAYTYQSSEVLVLCFSVCDRESFYSVVNCWLPEIQRHTKGKRPLLLVGTQIDLRTTSSSSASFYFPSDLGISSSPSFSFTDLRTSYAHDLNSSCSSPSSSKTSWEFRTSSSSSSTTSSPVFSFSRRNSISSITSFSSDLKDSSFSSSSSSTSPEEVSTEEGSQLAKMIGADCYIECSARSEEGVRQVFEHVVFSALKYRRKRSGLRGKFCREKPLSGKALQRIASAMKFPASRFEDTL